MAAPSIPARRRCARGHALRAGAPARGSGPSLRPLRPERYPADGLAKQLYLNAAARLDFPLARLHQREGLGAEHGREDVRALVLGGNDVPAVVLGPQAAAHDLVATGVARQRLV